MKTNRTIWVLLYFFAIATMLSCQNNASEKVSVSESETEKEIRGCDFFYEVDLAVYENDYQALNYWKCDADQSAWTEVLEYRNLEELPRLQMGDRKGMACYVLDSQSIEVVPKKMAVIRHYILVSRAHHSEFDIIGLESTTFRNQGYLLTDFFMIPGSLHVRKESSDTISIMGVAALVADSEMTIYDRSIVMMNLQKNSDEFVRSPAIVYTTKSKPCTELFYYFQFSLIPQSLDEIPKGKIDRMSFSDIELSRMNLLPIASTLVECDADGALNNGSETTIPITDLSIGFENGRGVSAFELKHKKCGENL